MNAVGFGAMRLRPVLLACSVLLAATAVSAERLPIRTYTHLDGLAHSRVTCVFSDSRGFIWFCTVDGLSRFDGQGFTTYGLREGLASARINDFIETRDGTYWVATNGEGVYRFRPLTVGPLAARSAEDSDRTPVRFSQIPVGDNSQTARVNVILEDRAGRLWAGTDGGLFWLDRRSNPEVFRRVELKISGWADPAVQVWALAENANGSLWIGTSWGLVSRSANGETVQTNIQPSQGADHVRALLLDRDGRLWVGHSSGVLVFTETDHRVALAGWLRRQHLARPKPPAFNGEAVWLTDRDALAPGYVTSLLQSSDGHIWIATLNGLTHFDGHHFRAYTQANGIAKPTALAEDRDGNIWIGTLDGGAQRFVRDGFRTYAAADGLSDAMVRTVVEDARGEVYFVSHNQYIHRFDGARFTAIRPNFWGDVGTPASLGWAILSRDGEWWIPGGAGLYRFPRVTRVDELAHVRPRLYTSRDGLAGEDILRLFEDSRGDIWIGKRIATTLVVTRWQRSTDTFHRYGERDGLPAYSRIFSFAEDRSGNVWIGFQNGGLARYDGRFSLFTPDDGAPSGGVSELHVDSRGRLWIGAQRPALSRIDSPEAERPLFVVPSAEPRLSGDSVGCILEDRKGLLYLCTVGGALDRLNPDTGEITRFSAANGLFGADLFTAFQDRRRDIWFGSYTGVHRLVPGNDPPQRTPIVRIGAVRVAGENYFTSDLGEQAIPLFELRPDQNRIEIDFFALGAAQDSRLRYQYRLEGSDSAWNPPTDRRDVNYGSLSPGQYRFLVRALGPDDAITSEPATVEFTILEPLWGRWWFQGGVVAAVCLIGLAAHRFRLQRLLALERVRMRIASDLHDDIGGSLSRIAIQSEVARRETSLAEPSAKRLMDIAASARDVVDALGDVVWAVDPHRDDLDSIFRRLREYGSETIGGNGARWSFISTGELAAVKLTPEARRHLFLLLKEALTNAARHSSASHVTLRVELTKRELLIELTDNGKGFDPAWHAEGHESSRHGVASMHARASRLHAALLIESAPGRGTRLLLSMPVKGPWKRMIMRLQARINSTSMVGQHQRNNVP